MTYLLVAVMTILFIEVFLIFKLWGTVRRIFSLSSGAIAVLRSESYDDEYKERMARSTALRMLSATGSFLVKLLSALAAPLVLYATSVYSGLVDRGELDQLLVSWTGLVGCVVIGIGYVKLRDVVRR